MRRRKIFVVSKGFHDLKKAEKFGDIRYLVTEYVNRYSPSQINRKFVEILENESSEEDLIMLSGQVTMNGIATGIFGALHGRVNYLHYRKERNDYEIEEYVYDFPQRKEVAHEVS